MVKLIADRLVPLLLLFELVAKVGDNLAKGHLRELVLLSRRQIHILSLSVVHEFSAFQLSNDLPHGLLLTHGYELLIARQCRRLLQNVHLGLVFEHLFVLLNQLILQVLLVDVEVE